MKRHPEVSTSKKLAGEEGTSLPLTKRRIGKKILFFLSNPHIPVYYLDPLCNLSIAYQVVLKYAPVLKYQARELLPEDDPPGHFVIKDTDNAIEIILPLAPPTPRAFTPRSDDETEVMMDPSTLPESVRGVVSC